jgi:hypothetical protein
MYTEQVKLENLCSHREHLLSVLPVHNYKFYPILKRNMHQLSLPGEHLNLHSYSLLVIVLRAISDSLSDIAVTFSLYM